MKDHPQTVNDAETTQSRKSMSGVFDSLVQSNLMLVKSVKRTIALTSVCVVLTTASVVAMAVNLHLSRVENQNLIAVIKASYQLPRK